MTDLQHARIADLCAELRLSAMADLYGPAATANHPILIVALSIQIVAL